MSIYVYRHKHLIPVVSYLFPFFFIALYLIAYFYSHFFIHYITYLPFLSWCLSAKEFHMCTTKVFIIK